MHLASDDGSRLLIDGDLVIDNDGKLDEGCIGDLTVIEAAAAGISGLLVWGAHRDTAEILALATPVFSYGSMPVGPVGARGRHPEALRSARVGEVEVTRADHVFGDDDGVLFVPADRAAEVAKAARAIRERERAQAELVRSGASLRAQLRFAEYLERRRREPSWTFRDHLREIGGAIEE